METALQDINSIDGVLCLFGGKYVLTGRTNPEEDGAYIFNGTRLIRPPDHLTNTKWLIFINQIPSNNVNGSVEDEILRYFPRRINTPE